MICFYHCIRGRDDLSPRSKYKRDHEPPTPFAVVNIEDPYHQYDAWGKPRKDNTPDAHGINSNGKKKKKVHASGGEHGDRSVSGSNKNSPDRDHVHPIGRLVPAQSLSPRGQLNSHKPIGQSQEHSPSVQSLSLSTITFQAQPQFAGAAYVSKIVALDPEESNMMELYESGFALLMQEKGWEK